MDQSYSKGGNKGVHTITKKHHIPVFVSTGNKGVGEGKNVIVFDTKYFIFIDFWLTSFNNEIGQF